AVGSRIANEDIPPPQGVVQEAVKTAFEGAGVAWDVVNRLVQKESGWDITADNGTAQGLFQVKGGSMDWRENIQQGLDHWLEAGRVATNALGGKVPTPADQYVVYQQGAG